ncbi:hypothetical protein Tco_0081843, partial [Tanacetum coccineum]
TYQRKQKTQKLRRIKKDTELPQTSVPLDHRADEAVYKEGVTGMDTGGSPRRQETIGGTPSQTRKRKSSISHPRRRKYIQVETSSNDGLDEEDASKQGRRRDKLEPMFNDKDLEELDDYIENVEEETVDVAATGVTTVSAQVSTAGVTISTAEPRTPPITTTVFDDEDVTMAMA